MPSGGEGKMERQANHLEISGAITSLALEVVRFEELLREIQGQDNPPSAEKGQDLVQLSLMTFLQEGAQQIYKLKERLVETRNGIRDTIF